MATQAQAKYTITADDKTAGVLRRIESNFKNHMGKLSSYGQTMSMSLSAPIAAFGILALKTAADYETSMNRVQGVTGATGAEMAKLEAQAKQLGATTSFSASEAGDAMGYLAQAGFDTNQILAAMPATLQLAEASQMDLAAAADITSNILAGYGKQVEDLAHINDVLVKAADATNTDITGLGEAMSYVAPVASGMGIAFEEAVGALGMLSNAGIKGSMAGTTLREALGSLANPSAEAADLLKELGVNAFDAKGNMLPLVQIIEQLQGSGASAGEMLTIFGQRAGPGMMALVKQGAGALADLKVELENSGGAAERMAGIQMKGLNGAIKNLQSAFEGLQIALVESGILQWVTNFVTRIAGWISSALTASDSTIKFALAIVGIVAAIGPAMMLLGKLVSLISFMTSPIGWVITAVGLMVLAWSRWGDDIKKIVAPVTDWLADKFDEVAGFVLLLISNLLKGLAFLFDQLSKLPGQIGADMGTAADALKGWGDALDVTRDKIITADDGAGLLAETVAGVTAFTQGLIDKLKGLGGELPATTAAMTDTAATAAALGKELEGIASSSGSATVGTDGLTDAQRRLKGEQERGARVAKEQAAALAKLAWTGKAAMKTLGEAGASAAEGLADAFGDAVFRSKNLLESLAETAKSVFSFLLSGFIKLGLANMFPALAPVWGFVDKPAKNMTGGSLGAMQPSWVGENGRELFIPSTAGTVVPSSKVGGQVVVHNEITIVAEGNPYSDPIAFRSLAARLQREMERTSRTFYTKSPAGA